MYLHRKARAPGFRTGGRKGVIEPKLPICEGLGCICNHSTIFCCEAVGKQSRNKSTVFKSKDIGERPPREATGLFFMNRSMFSFIRSYYCDIQLSNKAENFHSGQPSLQTLTLHNSVMIKIKIQGNKYFMWTCTPACI